MAMIEGTQSTLSPFACSDLALNVSPFSELDLLQLRKSTVGKIDDMSNFFISNRDIKDTPSDFSSTQESTTRHVTFSDTVIYSMRFLHSLKNVEQIEFRRCTFRLSKFDQTFGLCSKLQRIQFIDCTMDEVTTLSYVFHHARSLVSVEFRNCSTKGLKNLEYVFRDCGRLLSEHCVLEIDTSKVKSVEGMFYDCYAITSLSMCKHFKTESLRSMRKFCQGCSALRDISGITDWDVSNVETMSYLFASCDSLTGLLALYLWKTSKLRNLKFFLMNSGVYNLAGLRDFDVRNVRKIGAAFFRSQLVSTQGLEQWKMPFVTDLSGLFYECRNLVDLSGIQNWNVENVRWLRQTFCCTRIRNVDALKLWNTRNLEDMTETFKFCFYLVNVDGLLMWNVQNVTEMIATFYYTGIYDTDGLRRWVTSRLLRANYMFYKCRNLTSLDGVAHFDMRTVFDITRMFANCESLNDVSALRSWEFMRLTYASGTFEDCQALQIIDALSAWNMSSVEELARFMAFTGVSDIRGLLWELNRKVKISEFSKGCPLIHGMNEAPIFQRLNARV